MLPMKAVVVSFPLQKLGSSMIVVGLLARLPSLPFADGVPLPDPAMIGQVLSIVILVAGFAFQQIGRRQEYDAERRQRQDERDEEARRRVQEKDERRERDAQLAALVQAQSENVRLQAEVSHAETLQKIEATTAATTEAIATLANSTPAAPTVERTPDTVLVEVPIAVEGAP